MVPQVADMTEIIDKIDMSLDDIIKLNREQNRAAFNGRTRSFQRFRNTWGSRWTTGNMRLQGMRNGRFGVKTGLAARKMALWNGVSPLNRAPLSTRNLEDQWSPFRRRSNISRRLGYSPSLKRNYYNSSYSQATAFRRGLRMDEQRDNRQATYFQKRGLEVETTLEMEQHEEFPEINRTYPHMTAVQESEEMYRSGRGRPFTHEISWRTSMSSSGILTVSIDNPAAVALPSMRMPRPSFPFLLKKEGSEPKVPKGVPLDFDINSVVKQTGITLNERFKILKEQRLSHAIGKGSRFVTVG